ncbi:MAG: hypothetical protein Q4Q25_04760, partial [Methanocorpusculum sp.]|nr:hypothetical protein [Methanocorpusculum sp.]
MSIVDSVHSAAVAVQNHIAEQVSKKNEQTKPAKTETANASESSTDAVELTEKGSKAVENGVGEVVSADTPETDEEEKTTITINGTDGNDTIDVTILKDGSYSLVVNGEETTYTAEEAERLVINGGDGNDTINIHQE